MSQLQLNLFHNDLQSVFDLIKDKVPNHEYDYKKHIVAIRNENHEDMGFLRLPLHILLDEELTIVSDRGSALYLSIESGSAAVCVMQGKENAYHSTFSAYMKRGKQGFSQIKYLKKKGKSKAGSRVRLSATTSFFENINSTLTELFEQFKIDRVGLSCTKTLIPFLFKSKVPCPFDKKSPTLYKIPLHIPHANYTNLDAAIRSLWAPVLFYNEKDDSQIQQWFAE